MLGAIWAIVIKEFVQLTRTRMALKRLFTFQILNFLMLAGIDVTVRDMSLAIVDQAHTIESRDLVDKIVATKTFSAKFVTSSEEQAREHIRSGRAKAAVVIAPDFGRARAAGDTGQFLLLVDGSDSMSSTQAISAISGVAARVNAEVEQEYVEPGPTVSVHTVLLFNPTGRTSSFMLPAVLVLSLATGYSGSAMRRLVMERAGGHLERLVMTPVNALSLIVGKLVPWFVIGMANVVLFLLVMHFAFQVPVRGSVPLLLGAASLYVVTVLSVGLAIAAGAKGMADANTTWAIVMFPAIFLSGYVYPLSSLPKWLLPVSYAMPQTHFLEIMRGICLRGANASELAPELVYLVVAPLFFGITAAIRFKRSILD